VCNRTLKLNRFLFTAGWGEAKRENLAQDASFRRYERLTKHKKSLVLMDAPPEQEKVIPFIQISGVLRRLGFSAPAIVAKDTCNGFLLIEDFGDATFTHLLETGADSIGLYSLAIDNLIELHRLASGDPSYAQLPYYDDDMLLRECNLFIDWYMPVIGRQPLNTHSILNYKKIWSDLFPLCRRVENSMVLRDFHVDNLIKLRDREGLQACGLLDFQDAVRGPKSYDFISLVEDARRDVPLALSRKMRQRYVKAFPTLDENTFDISCAVLAAQRHCKVLGIFARLSERDGKKEYLKHIPRVWRLLEKSLKHPELAILRDWFESFCPMETRIISPQRPV
tara:strand:- start:116 stop:1126 length:1011 start_codon:yes stop_codon:yes gene_type:complete